MDELTGFQWDVLYVIAGLDEPNGLAIKKQLEEYYESRVDRGQLYPNIDSLAEQGLVEKGVHDKRTNRYTLIDDGQDAIKERFVWMINRLEDVDRLNG